MACVDDLFKSLKAKDVDGLSRTELERFEKELRTVRQTKDAQAVVDRAEALGEEGVVSAFRQKRQAVMNRQIQMTHIRYVNTTFPDNPALGFQSLQASVQIARKNVRSSADLLQRTATGKYIAGSETDLRAAGVWKEFRNNVDSRSTADALYRIGVGLDLEGLPSHSIEIAKVMQKYNQLTRLEANKAGAWIADLPGRIVAQSHDMFKIRKMGFANWRRLIDDLLDFERTFERPEFRDLDEAEFLVQMDEFFQTTYNALSSGVHLASAGIESVGGGASDVAARVSAGRLLHFKDGLAWYDYNTVAGAKDLHEAYLGGLRRMGRNTGLMQQFGPNAESNRRAIHRALLGGMTEGPREKFAKSFKDGPIDWQWKELTGQTSVPYNHTLARIGSMIRNAEVVSKLNFATISAFGDTLMKADIYKHNGVGGYLDAWGIAMAESVGRMNTGTEARNLASSFGVMFDSMNAHAIHRMNGVDDTVGAFAKAAQFTMRWTGMNWWTDSARISASHTLAHNLGLNASKSWDSIVPDLRRNLDQFGFHAKTWELARGAVQEAPDGRVYMTTEGVQSLPEARLEAFVKDEVDAFGSTLVAQRRAKTKKALNKPFTKVELKKIAARKTRLIDQAREDLDRRLRSYIVDQVDSAVLIPDIKAKALINQGRQAGTWHGEFNKMFFQFKSFSISATQRTLGRNIFAKGFDDPTGSLSTQAMKAILSGNGEISGLVHLIGMSAVMGYMTMSAKDMLKGKKPRIPDDLAEAQSIFAASLLQGGGMGLYGDFLFGTFKDRFGRGFVEAAGGPFFGDAVTVASILKKGAEGEPGEAFTTAAEQAVNNIPNFWYTRLVTDMLFFHWLRETISPGYLDRTERMIKKENDQEFYLEPSESVPRGGFRP